MILNYLFDFLFLPVIFFIGLITSYQDFKEGKIKNKWIILGLVWGLGIYILFLIWALAVPYLSQIYSKQFTFILPSYILKVFINSVIALIIGYLLWYFNLWSAGDAKLFFVFSLLLPLKYYWRTSLPYFPSFALLINIFIPLLLFLMGQNLFYFLKTISTSKITGFFGGNLLKFKTNYPLYLKEFLGFLLIFAIFQIIKYELGSWLGRFGQWQTLAFLLVMAARKPLRRVFKKTWVLTLIFLLIIFYLTVGQLFYSHGILSKVFSLIKNSVLFMLIFIIFSALLSYIQEEKKKHLPFAAWALVGVLLTIVLKGSLISLIMRFFSK